MQELLSVTLTPLLYQCVETRSIEVFWLLSQPFPHLVGHHLWISIVIERISRLSCELLSMKNTSHRKQESFIYAHSLHWISLPTKTPNRTLLIGQDTRRSRSPFWPLKPAPEYAHALLLTRLSWNWILSLPTDTNRKCITPITAVILPFVSYLLTLPHMKCCAIYWNARKRNVIHV
jgi:hypothetical protein